MYSLVPVGGGMGDPSFSLGEGAEVEREPLLYCYMVVSTLVYERGACFQEESS